MKQIIKLKGFKIVLSVVGGLFLILYLRLFFTRGMVVYDEFFTRRVQGEMTTYQAPFLWQETFVEVTGDVKQQDEVQVAFHLDNGKVKTYVVKLGPYNLVNISDLEGSVMFDGYFVSNGVDYYLMTNDDEFYFDEVMAFVNDGVLLSEKLLNPYLVLSFATGNHLEFRGDVLGLFTGLMILILTWIDYLWPEFFFRLKYSLSVDNPEPSEMYESIQKLSWIVMPIIALVILLISIC